MQNSLNTKKETINQIQLILNKPESLPRILTPEEFKIVYSVLINHPNFKEKEKGGIRDICVKKTIYNKNGFIIIRLDGTTTDFSYLKCINGKNQFQEIKSMFRSAIRDQIVHYRKEAFKHKKELICPITGETVTIKNCHVDHHKPTFDNLFKDFIKYQKVDLTKIVVGGQQQDNTMSYYFVDKDLESKWCSWHFMFANLRITSRNGNLRRGKNEY